MNAETVKLELLNPRGEIEPPPVYTPSPRIKELAGKRIGLYSNSKPGMDNFYAAIAEFLKKKYPTVTTLILKGSFEIRDEDAKTFASQIDAFIYAVGD
jgi:hypothetical protein